MAAAFSPPPVVIATAPRARVCPDVCRRRDGRRARVVLGRGIVIFADYLSDLVVLDIAGDANTLGGVGLGCVVAGAVAGFLLTDFVSAVWGWVAWYYFAPGADARFCIFGGVGAPGKAHRTDCSALRAHGGLPDSIPTGSSSDFVVARASEEGDGGGGASSTVVPVAVPNFLAVVDVELMPEASESAARMHQEPLKRDFLLPLVDSCALVTLPLTMLSGWATSPAANTPLAVFFETALVMSLSLAALSPLAAADAPTATCGVVRALRFLRVLKPQSAPGWSQLCGIWDEPLERYGVLNALESALVRHVGLRQRPEIALPTWAVKPAEEVKRIELKSRRRSRSRKRARSRPRGPP